MTDNTTRIKALLKNSSTMPLGTGNIPGFIHHPPDDDEDDECNTTNPGGCGCC